MVQELLRYQPAVAPSSAEPTHPPTHRLGPHPAKPHPTAVSGWPSVRLNSPAARVPPMGLPCTALALSSSRAMSWQKVAGWYSSLLQA